MEFKLHNCLVRTFLDADATSIARYANNKKIWLNLRDAFPHPYTINDAMAFIKNARSIDPPTIFAIEKDKEAIGAIGFSIGKDVERISAEIGYWLAEPFWGQGIVTQALEAVTKYAISQFNLKRIYALPYEWNPASFRVLEKAGYRLETRMRNSAIKNDKVIDQLLYAFVVNY